MPLTPKTWGSYTPATTYDGNEIIPFAKAGGNGTIKVSTLLGKKASLARFNVRDFGAVGDARRGQYVNVTAGGTDVGCNNVGFTQADVGKNIILFMENANDNSGTGLILRTTIAALSSTNPNVVTIATPSPTAMNGSSSQTYCIVGTDDSAAFIAAMTAAKLAIPTALNNNPNMLQGAGYSEVFVPGVPNGIQDQGMYMLNSQVVIPAGVNLNATAMIVNNLSDPLVPVLKFTGYSSSSALNIEATWGSGIQSGLTTNPATHNNFDDVTIWRTGNAAGQKAIFCSGYDHKFNNIWLKAGNTGVWHESGSDFVCQSLFAIGNITAVYMNGAQQVYYGNIFMDTVRGQAPTGGMVIDNNSGNIYANIHAFDADGTTYSINPVVSIGSVTTNQNKDINLLIRANNTGGSVVSVANCAETFIRFTATNTKLPYGRSNPITNGVIYGANVIATTVIEGNIPDVTTPYTGTKVGLYTYTRFNVETALHAQAVSLPANLPNGNAAYAADTATTGGRMIDFRITGENTARFVQDVNGKQEWGAGGSSARDVNLYRNAADELKTDDALTAALGIRSTLAAPSTSSSAGVAGTATWDANYIYICTATNTWKRVAIATW